MIEGRVIICIASAWDYDPTGKHHIMKRLCRQNKVIWVNYHGTRRPTFGRNDLKGCWRGLRRVAGGVRRINPSMVQVTPLVIPGAKHPLVQRISNRLLMGRIKGVLSRFDFSRSRPIQIWCFAPDVPGLIGRFGEECFVYYCVDEHSEFEGVDRRRIIELERETLIRADMVITSSDRLLVTKRSVRPDAVLVRHGVDYDHFASAWKSRRDAAPELAGIPRPVFGFFGMIAHWIDVDLLAEVARLRPQYSFVLIGECQTNVSRLRELRNVYFLGRRPYESLPDYCAGFDAAMMLFKTNALTRHVNPIKMLEYLAAGLPVVSTPLPEANRYSGVIVVADSPARFAEACDRVLTPNYLNRASIGRLVEDETWDSRVEELSAIVMLHVKGINGRFSRPMSEVLPSRAHKGGLALARD